MKPSYDEYRKLSPSEKKARINNAKASEQFRKPNPQGDHQFDELGFIDFRVQQNGKQIRLETYRHHPKAEMETKGVIFMFHGLNSHLGHCAHLADYFSHQGFVSVGFDHRGFGRSEGIGGYLQNLQTHLKDCRQFISVVKPMYKGIPQFILGQSMGGMTAYHLTLNEPELFDGAILFAPALKNHLGGFIISLGKLISSVLPGTLRLIRPLGGKNSQNPTIGEFIQNDQYAYSGRACLSTVAMLGRAMDESPATFKDYKCPFIVIQGGLDKLVNPEVAFELYDNSPVANEEKELLFYQDMWHDIWHSEYIGQIMQIISQWLCKRSNQAKIDEVEH